MRRAHDGARNGSLDAAIRADLRTCPEMFLHNQNRSLLAVGFLLHSYNPRFVPQWMDGVVSTATSITIFVLHLLLV